MKRIIQWTRWSNPLGGGVEYADETSADEPLPTMVRPVIPTASGLMPLTVYGNFAAHFNFWMGHANFNFSRPVVDVLRKIPGVETLDVVTRYSARFGFGRCFDDSAVRRDIEHRLGVEAERRPDAGVRVAFDQRVRQAVKVLEDHARAHYKFWAIYVIPNGEIAFSNTEAGVEYEKTLDLYRQSQKLAGGVVFSSHED